MQVRNSLQDSLGIELPATLVFDAPTTSAISRFIMQRLQPSTAAAAGASAAARLRALRSAPGAAQEQALLVMGASAPRWTLADYAAGGDGVTAVPYWRWDKEGQRGAGVAPSEVLPRFGVFLPYVDQFDCAAFGVTPLEASTMDPQQRLLLHASAEAIPAAALSSSSSSSGNLTSVYVGIGSNDYEVLANHAGVSVSAFSFTAASAAVASGRLAFVMGFNGPSASIDTACSASMVALHMAVGSLRDGSSTSSLVAGVLLCLVPQSTLMVQRAGMLAPDGRCKVSLP
jgi:acyl transferase domain-containing protein